MPRRLALASMLLVLCGVRAATAQSLTPLPLASEAASLHWPGAQFLQADAAGRVFLLRSDPLEIYPVTRAHQLGEAVRIDRQLASGHLLDAAMSSQGVWVLLLGPEIDIVAGEHATRLPQIPWLPVSVSFLAGDAVAAVMAPRLVAGERPDDPSSLPLLMSVGHDSWDTELTEATLQAPRRGFDIMAERASRAVLLLSDGPNRRYLLARQYAYHIELRRGGRQTPLEELRVGKGEVVLRGAAEADQRMAREVETGGLDRSSPMATSAFRGVSTILALSHGPGGRLYVLVGPGAAAGPTCALDRIEWEARRVERVALDLPCDGRFSLAAGSDGLYIAGYSGESGRFFLPWDTLETARWSPVREARFTP